MNVNIVITLTRKNIPSLRKNDQGPPAVEVEVVAVIAAVPLEEDHLAAAVLVEAGNKFKTKKPWY